MPDIYAKELATGRGESLRDRAFRNCDYAPVAMGTPRRMETIKQPLSQSPDYQRMKKPDGYNPARSPVLLVGPVHPLGSLVIPDRFPPRKRLESASCLSTDAKQAWNDFAGWARQEGQI